MGGRNSHMNAVLQKWQTAKVPLKLVHVKATKKDVSQRSDTHSGMTDDTILTPIIANGPPVPRHPLHRMIKKKSRVESNRSLECHSLVQNAFRSDGYKWIIEQLVQTSKFAVRKVNKYVGQNINERAHYFQCKDSTIDLVRARISDVQLETFSRCVWGTFIVPVKTTEWEIKCLERINDNVYYTRVILRDGIAPGTPLILNVLQSRIHTTDQVIIVLRNITEDTLFPLPNQAITLRISGWFVFERDHHTTRAKSLVRFTGGESFGETKTQALAMRLFELVEMSNGSKVPAMVRTNGSLRRQSIATSSSLECR